MWTAAACSRLRIEGDLLISCFYLFSGLDWICSSPTSLKTQEDVSWAYLNSVFKRWSVKRERPNKGKSLLIQM